MGQVAVLGIRGNLRPRARLKCGLSQGTAVTPATPRHPSEPQFSHLYPGERGWMMLMPFSSLGWEASLTALGWGSQPAHWEPASCSSPCPCGREP